MGLFYSISRSNVTLSTSADLLSIVSGATRSLRIREIMIAGMATASAACELGLFRVTTAGVTGSGGLTPTPLNPAFPAPACTNFTAWGTQPVLGANILRLGVNANGGLFRWVAPPGSEIEVPGGANAAGSVSFRPALGSSPVSFHVIVEEI